MTLPLTNLPNGLSTVPLKVGTVWVRETNGVLEQSTDTTDGTDGTWDAIIAEADLLSEDAGNVLTDSPLFWVGTQNDYDAIASPDANTIYTIIPG